MEERPNEGALGRYSNHGEAKSNTGRLNKLVNNDQCHCQHQDEETSTKKTGYEKVSRVAKEGEEIPTALSPDPVSHPDPSGHEDPLPVELLLPAPACSSPASPQPPEAPRRPGQHCSAATHTDMDSPSERPADCTTLEARKEALAALNGLVASPSGPNAGPLTNGFPGKPGAATDNDGSGSENGYTTPKKRRNGQRSSKSVSGGDVVTAPPSTKAAHPPSAGKQLPEQVPSPGATTSPPSNNRSREPQGPAPQAAPLPPGEFPRKNSEGKPAVSKKFEERPLKAKAATAAASAAAKDDSWTLFKPPPAFPVDNSSAKIVPKISYASKVKENLNRASAPACPAAERDLLLPPSPSSTPTPAPPAPGKLSQVPMSAVKTITSTSFTNGPLPPVEASGSGGSSGCPLPGAPFNSPTAAAGAAPVPSPAPAPVLLSPAQGGDNVASTSPSPAAPTGGGTTVVPEPRKPSLFVYPHAAGLPSNMQLSLPSGRQAEPAPSTPTGPGPATPPTPSSNPTGPAQQKSLGEIFQNQWGLSFINEPSAGPEGGGQAGPGAGAGRTEGKGRPTVVTFQGGFPSGALPPLQGTSIPLPPRQGEAGSLDKRTTPLVSAGRGAPPRPSPSPAALPQEGGLLQTPSLPSGALKEQPRTLSAIVFSSSSSTTRELGGDVVPASPTHTAPAPARELGPHKGLDRRASWGMFDLKAAVIYHTKEMECILNLQKQDPKRIVLYRDPKDAPNQ